MRTYDPEEGKLMFALTFTLNNLPAGFSRNLHYIFQTLAKNPQADLPEQHDQELPSSSLEDDDGLAVSF